MKIVVAGAGLVGPLLSINLRRRGHEITLYERRPDPQIDHASPPSLDSRRSINLVITSRGINALNELRLWQKVRQITVPVRGRMIHSIRGETSFQPYGRDDNECNYSVSRSRLNQVLIDEARRAGVRIEFDSALEGVDLPKKIARFGTHDTNARARTHEVGYDLFFAADGAGSIARQALEREGVAHSQTEWLDTDYKELVIPKECGKKLKQQALHIWPRGTHMMMALPNLEGDFTVTLYLPQKNHEWAFDSMRSEVDVVRLFESQFSDAIDLMPSYAQDFFANPQGRLGTVRTSPWVYRDSFCLIGDAAHAIVPFFGQGMNLGFEDCVELMKALHEMNENGDALTSAQWMSGLNNFDLRQRPNANAIADMALENFIEMRDRVGQADFQLKKKIEARLEKEFPSLYRSRYGMITYTLIPYSLAQKAGEIQSRILDELAQKASPDGDVDLKYAHELIKSRLEPLYREHRITTARFAP